MPDPYQSIASHLVPPARHYDPPPPYMDLPPPYQGQVGPMVVGVVAPPPYVANSEGWVMTTQPRSAFDVEKKKVTIALASSGASCCLIGFGSAMIPIFSASPGLVACGSAFAVTCAGSGLGSLLGAAVFRSPCAELAFR